MKTWGTDSRNAIALVCLLLLCAIMASGCSGGNKNGSTPSSSVTSTSPTAPDTTPPTTQDNAPAGWQNRAVTVTLTATDVSGVAKTLSRLDGRGWKTGTAVRVTGNGVHRLVYYSIDKVGNSESKHTCTVKIDQTRPVTTAFSSPIVQKGQKAVLKFEVRDLTPKARVTVVVKGTVNETFALGWQRTGRTLSWSHTFPVGTYSYVVNAKDQAGNPASRRGSATFQVKDVRYLARIAASVSDANPAQYTSVTVYGRALDQFDRPIAGASVSFTWNYKTVSHTEIGITGSDGVVSSTRYISGATIGWYVQIDVLASWNGKTISSTTGFTPQ